MATRKGYTQNSLWEAVYTAIPSFRDARAAGCYINLPGAVRNAAAEFFTDNKTEPAAAIAIIRQAMLDLRDIGEFIFTE